MNRLISGHCARACLQLRRMIAEAKWYFRTKSDRGYDLAVGKREHAVFAEPIKLKKNMDGEAFRIIARCSPLWRECGCVTKSRTGRRHQMRVGLRRRIQDALGALNDFIAHRKLAADAALKAPAQHRRARAFFSGVVLGREEEYRL
jgi:hypothetical protein